VFSHTPSVGESHVPDVVAVIVVHDVPTSHIFAFINQLLKGVHHCETSIFFLKKEVVWQWALATCNEKQNNEVFPCSKVKLGNLVFYINGYFTVET
jgi:hypothetical protein